MSIKQALNHATGNTERNGYQVEKITDMVIKDSGNITARGLHKAENNLDDALADFQKARAVNALAPSCPPRAGFFTPVQIAK